MLEKINNSGNKFVLNTEWWEIIVKIRFRSTYQKTWQDERYRIVVDVSTTSIVREEATVGS